MCFSPEADAIVGGIVIVVGVDALRHTTAKKQLALASLPVVFGVHQVTEAFVWWGLRGDVSHTIERIALWIYLVIALVALPAFVPLAVRLIEPLALRRRIIGALWALGLVVAGVLAAALIREPIGASIDGRHIAYSVEGMRTGGPIIALYVLATCGALLACSYRDIAALGAVNLAAVPLLLWLTSGGFVSLWCFWAALVSVVIALHMRRQAGGPVATSNTAGGSRHGDGGLPASAARIAFHTRSGVHGMSRWRMPRWLSASTTALCTAGVEPIVPDSPMPFAPSGLRGDGVSVLLASKVGSSAALGIA